MSESPYRTISVVPALLKFENDDELTFWEQNVSALILCKEVATSSGLAIEVADALLLARRKRMR